ncbi:type II toxin-antitoxin system prevent-host-death family antitoxin [Roseobacter sp. AzwK-3b]|uniref:type II toxin-antitoxin system prevent-host-death family antitoxin n=1 Tax=Roseobacter sp. AzwK-3b TaxID=351016 RepID=UPI000A009374|nr:type II toxin-antitoxin system prevent-host-death family antitoxin [Roseobacter sp. AzwK-3b]
MRNFSSTELANKTGDVLAAAAQEPVNIKRHGKTRFVLLSVEQFERLSMSADQRRSVHVEDLTAEEADELIAQLEHSIAHD